MHGDLGEHVGRVYVDPLSLAVDAARRLVVPVGHAEPPPLVAHEAVEADLALDTVNVFFTNRANGSAPSAQTHFHQSRKRAFAASG